MSAAARTCYGPFTNGASPIIPRTVHFVPSHGDVLVSVGGTNAALIPQDVPTGPAVLDEEARNGGGGQSGAFGLGLNRSFPQLPSLEEFLSLPLQEYWKHCILLYLIRESSKICSENTMPVLSSMSCIVRGL